MTKIQEIVDKFKNDLRQQIDTYIDLLNKLLLENLDQKKLTYYELRDWIPNCIECLQFALDNEELLREKPSLYEDTLSTIGLLYSWMAENKEWAYIVLKQKFRKIYSGREMGEALKYFSEGFKKYIKDNDEDTISNNNVINFIDNNGNFKSTTQILSELSDKWAELTSN